MKLTCWAPIAKVSSHFDFRAPRGAGREVEMASVRSARMVVVLVSWHCFLGSGNPPELQAQSRPETPLESFEVASIKPQPWTNEGRVGVFVRGNTLTGEHV